MQKSKPATFSSRPGALGPIRTNEARHLGLWLIPRLGHVAASLLYLFLFLDIYRQYISVLWGYTGLRYRDLSVLESGIVIAGVALVAAFMPKHIARPSSIVLWMMFTFVYVPTMAITFMVGYAAPESYFGSLAALTAVFVSACVVGQLPLQHEFEPTAVPGRVFGGWMLVACIAMAVMLYFRFGSIMSFANVQNILAQRYAARDLLYGIVAYIATYHTNVVGAGLVAVGLVSRKNIYLFAGVSTFVLSYMISAQKISLMTPVIMLSLYLAYTFTKSRTIYYTLGMCALIYAVFLIRSQSESAGFAAALILTRAIAIPAQTFSQYSDFFEKMGHTWWSNVKGIGLIVPAPEALASDPYWPQLGFLVGREYVGSVLQNSNANPFSGEGAAAAGAFGVLVIGAAWALWLRALDRAAWGWDRAFVLLVLTPVALSLTNGHLSTVLLSFGGLFWLLLFAFYKPGLSRNQATIPPRV